MNSGCYGNDISKVLVSIQAIDLKNMTEIEIKNKDIKFLYRGTDLSDDLIIVSAKIKGSSCKKRRHRKKTNRNDREKKTNSTKSNKKRVGALLKI